MKIQSQADCVAVLQLNKITQNNQHTVCMSIKNILVFICSVAVYHLLWTGGICINYEHLNQIMLLSTLGLHLLDFASRIISKAQDHSFEL